MKMRVRGNSIRLRLTQSEVVRFRETGLVEESVRFSGKHKLIYALESSAEAETVKANFNDNRIVIIVPQDEAERWASSNEIGIKGEQKIGDKTLRLLIEKDFACLESREGEEAADTFPHPLENMKC